MGRQIATQAQVLHAIPGRVRVHLPRWFGTGTDLLTARLRRLPGVRDVQANPLTGNVLLRFDPTVADAPTLLVLIQESTEALCDPAFLPLCARQRVWAAGPPRPDTKTVATIVAAVARPRTGVVGAGPWLSLLPRAADLIVGLLLADSPLGLLACGYEAMRLLLHLVGPHLLGRNSTLIATYRASQSRSVQVRVVVRG